MTERARAGWTKPQLMAIVRMHGDEAVLDSCKTGSAGSVSPGGAYFQCDDTPGIGCQRCSAIASS